MKRFSLFFCIAATLVGCAIPEEFLPPIGYRNPQTALRQTALTEVASYATSVKAALVNETPQQVMEKGKKAIADSLKDPSSAQFRNVRLVEYMDGVVICGDVNGKNSYGGYVGFRDFVSGINSGTMRDTETNPDYANITAAVNAGVDSACSGKPFQGRVSL